jgi:hypothetical protein
MLVRSVLPFAPLSVSPIPPASFADLHPLDPRSPGDERSPRFEQCPNFAPGMICSDVQKTTARAGTSDELVLSDAVTVTMAEIGAPTEGLTAVTVSIDGAAPVTATLNPLGRWTANLGTVGAGAHVIRATVAAQDGTATAAEIMVIGTR